MTIATLAKPANELSLEELKTLFDEKQAIAAKERQQKREKYETLRDDIVTGLVAKALDLSELIKSFKTQVWSDCDTMYKLLQEHSDRHRDGKGSFTMETADGKTQLSFKRQDNTKFDERATQAEKHILDFLTTQFGDEAPTSKLIRRLLERKKGQVDKDDVLKLISMKDEFDNENWRKGIELLQESIVPGETKYYAQFKYRSNEGEEWKTVLLDFAKI